ncbi:MAG: PQQ-binding-like beta-propeller repeat protein [Candidatus Hydrogenedentota bacterium]
MNRTASMKAFAVGIATALALLAPFAAGLEEAEHTAREILDKSGVQGGLLVYLDCGDGRVLAALGAGERYLAHGLEQDPAEREKARSYIHGEGLYGPVSVSDWDGERLPYAENTVNLLVCESADVVSPAEIERVLAPGGVALHKEDEAWTKTTKPWPEDIDEWTHYLHGPDNNAVARDEEVGPPRRLQWVNPPLWSRSHEHLASFSAAVSANGRLFYIMDKAPDADISMEPEWTLAARDAFNGAPLWERSIGPWEWHKRPFRSGPPDLARRLVADGDCVYATLGYGEPVAKLDAATGETLDVYAQSANTQEILFSDGVLYLVIGREAPEPEPDQAARAAQSDETFQWYLPIYEALRRETELMAVDAGSGETLWHKTGAEARHVMPTTLAVADDQVFFQNPAHVISLDAHTGDERWRAERPISRQRPAWTAPTLVVYDGVVLSADREAPDKPADDGASPLEWTVTAQGGRAPEGELIAFSAESGERLWSAPAREGYNAPVDVLVAGGLIWTGDLVQAGGPGIVEGRNPHTGEVERTRPPDGEFYDPIMSHARCYRHKATNRYLITGRSGVEFADIETGEAIANHWVRGECQYGVLPANGLLYAPPHPCACFILAKLNSFHALAAGEPVDLEALDQNAKRLQRGPAYDEVDPQNDSAEDWVTYRHDPARSGSTKAAVPSDDLGLAWETELDTPLTPPVAAEGRVYVASKDAHTLHVLDANSGERLWRFTADSRIDSPPTIWNGRAFFGSAGGWVYCLRAEDGALVWRYRAAPEDRLIVAHGQLESAWPVHGSVLVLPSSEGATEEAVLYASAGRSGYLDGGIVLVRLDAASGEERSRTIVHSRDPETGHQPHPLPRPTSGFSMPGALNDVLSAQTDSVYMRHLRFDLEGVPKDETKPHLHSAAGFLDDSWWHRTYWMVGSEMKAGWGEWYTMGNLAPSGRLLVVAGETLEEATVYGFGRDRYHRDGSHVGLQGTNYRLFAQDMSLDPRREAEEDVFPWEQQIEPLARAMVLTDKTVFAAGPGEVFTEADPAAAWEGHEGGVLSAICRETGEKQAGYSLESPPVFDGLIAIPGRLVFSSVNGRVVSFTPQ